MFSVQIDYINLGRLIFNLMAWKWSSKKPYRTTILEGEKGIGEKKIAVDVGK